MKIIEMKKEASELNQTFLIVDLSTPYKMFLDLIKDREIKLKKVKQEVEKKYKKVFEKLAGILETHWSGLIRCKFCKHELKIENLKSGDEDEIQKSKNNGE